jgi:hypothetical protein
LRKTFLFYLPFSERKVALFVSERGGKLGYSSSLEDKEIRSSGILSGKEIKNKIRIIDNTYPSET